MWTSCFSDPMSSDFVRTMFSPRRKTAGQNITRRTCDWLRDFSLAACPLHGVQALGLGIVGGQIEQVRTGRLETMQDERWPLAFRQHEVDAVIQHHPARRLLVVKGPSRRRL